MERERECYAVNIMRVKGSLNTHNVTSKAGIYSVPRAGILIKPLRERECYAVNIMRVKGSLNTHNVTSKADIYSVPRAGILIKPLRGEREREREFIPDTCYCFYPSQVHNIIYK